MTRRRRAAPLATAVLGAWLAFPAAAANELSTDVTVDLAGTLATDHDVVEDAASGAPALVDLGTLPDAVDVSGYSVAEGGDVLFSLDTAASLPGGLDATPRDVVRWNGSVYAVELDGSARGIPDGARIDAIGVVAGDLLLSFDVAVVLGGVTAADEDLVRLESTQPDVWSLFFDGSSAGVPEGADLDGADVVDASGSLALSFDVSGSAGGVAFSDEDVLDYAPSSGTWSQRFDGSAASAALEAADVDAVFVPEPGALAAALAAALALALRRRAARTRAALLAAALCAVATPALAVDGALEIHASCVATGCFAGDAPGWPVSTQSGRRYVLTSELVVPDANTDAVHLAAAATLDLGGFSIRGPTTCTGIPASCNNDTASGRGVVVSDGATVRNGAIRGMGEAGIFGIAKLVLIEDVWVDQSARYGIFLSFADGTVIRRCRVTRNDGDGITFSSGNGGPGSIIADNVVYGNAETGIIADASSIRGNNVHANGEVGIQMFIGTSSSGFGDNVVNENNGGNASPQTGGGRQLATNVCGGDTTCP